MCLFYVDVFSYFLLIIEFYIYVIYIYGFLIYEKYKDLVYDNRK